ncbi:RICIN domain-containing protein [Micromonospora sp. NPDC000663]|uniref:RICIN domain-containing protein n=1 Tax=Micromonospora sp. NPDC000663 TaxID=3364218 RepID=UPI0036AFE7D1
MSSTPLRIHVGGILGPMTWRRKLLAVALAAITLLALMPASSAKAAEYFPAEYFPYVSNQASNKCLDLEDYGFGRFFQQYQCQGTANQRFQFVKDPNLNSWEIKPSQYLSSNECLDIENYGQGTRVQRYPCRLSANQRWELTFLPGNVFQARSLAYPYKCLDAADWGAGLQVQVYPCHGGFNQRWVLSQGGV